MLQVRQQTIKTNCSECGLQTEWEYDLGARPLCVGCWGKIVDSRPASIRAAYRRRYYMEHQKEASEKQRQYRQSHKSLISERNRLYRLNHKAEISAYQRRYRENGS